jgi:hypothetical protein
MAELIEVANAMFKDKKNWNLITEEDKEKFFFIFNRYFSKKYPDKSKLLNDKLINKVSAMDTWYLFMLDKPYPKWFWSKSEKKSKDDISELEINFILEEYNIKPSDFEILMKYYPDIVNEEIKYYRDVRKGNK